MDYFIGAIILSASIYIIYKNLTKKSPCHCNDCKSCSYFCDPKSKK